MASNADRAATLVYALEAISVSQYWNEGELLAQLPLPGA